jgi:glycosyltransferase involved in cell wall biosynthesis
LETVVDGKTGLFFYQQDVASLSAAVKRFVATERSFDSKVIRAHAEQFPRSRFDREFKAFVDKA